MFGKKKLLGLVQEETIGHCEQKKPTREVVSPVCFSLASETEAEDVLFTVTQANKKQTRY